MASTQSKIDQDFNIDFVNELKEGTIAYQGCHIFPLKGEMWEEVNHKAMLSCGVESDWDPGSHSPGKDLSALSVKGCIYSENKNILKFHSFRTSRFENLQEKLDFFDGEGKNFEYYMILGRTEITTTKKMKKERRYHCFVIPADAISVSNLHWYSDDKKWYTDKVNGYHVEIVKAQSDEYWITLDLNEFTDFKELFNTSCDYELIGKTHKIVPI